MKINIKKQGMTLLNFMRKIGYSPDRKRYGDPSFSRRLRGGPFPRFHVYVDDLGDEWMIKLHLDQKGASYEGHTAHSGEYDGSLVEEEVERIKKVTEQLSKPKELKPKPRKRKSFWRR
ncbi:MAG: hypothetical protein WD471_02015, partial [Candidatus Paceibacterota bacterium]